MPFERFSALIPPPLLVFQLRSCNSSEVSSNSGVLPRCYIESERRLTATESDSSGGTIGKCNHIWKIRARDWRERNAAVAADARQVLTNCHSDGCVRIIKYVRSPVEGLERVKTSKEITTSSSKMNILFAQILFLLFLQHSCIIVTFLLLRQLYERVSVSSKNVRKWFKLLLDDQPRQYWIYANTDNELAT